MKIYIPHLLLALVTAFYALAKTTFVTASSPPTRAIARECLSREEFLRQIQGQDALLSDSDIKLLAEEQMLDLCPHH